MDRLKVPALARGLEKPSLLANPKNKLEVTQSSEGITVAVPANAPDPIATVIVLEHGDNSWVAAVPEEL